jgi:hypothetical protein
MTPMLKALKQARAAMSLLNPDEIRGRAERPLNIGLVATSQAAYDAIEQFLYCGMPVEEPRRLHRAGDRGAPSSVDLVIYEQGIPTGKGAYTFNRSDPDATVDAIVHDNRDITLSLARQFPAFRKPVIDRIVNEVSRENGLFAVATALPNVIPSMLELPWSIGEFASDTAFLTGNQIRMAFMIAAACGKPVGFSQQKAAIASLVAGAFGWRALARELTGHIPLGGGLIPKGAIAYAGTMAFGKGLEMVYHANREYTPQHRKETYDKALDHALSSAPGSPLADRSLHQ